MAGAVEMMFEEHHLSPAGRRFAVRRAVGCPDAYAFWQDDQLIASLAPPDPDAPVSVDGLVEWRLRLARSAFDLGVRTSPGGMPIEGALVELDCALEVGRSGSA